MGPDPSACQRGEPQPAQVCFLRFRSAPARGTPSLSTICAVQSGQQGTRKGSPVSSSRTSLAALPSVPPETAHLYMTAAFQRWESFARSLDITVNSRPVPTERRSLSRSVMEVTMATRAPGTVCSTSLFHFLVRCGGQRTSILLNPAMWAAAAAMKVLPVPISPTTVVPRWAFRERAAPLMASACAPRGFRSSWGRVPPFSEGW